MAVPGHSEPYRPRFNPKVEKQLLEIADIEGRKPNQQIVAFVVGGIADWHYQRLRHEHIKSVLNGNGNGKR